MSDSSPETAAAAAAGAAAAVNAVEDQHAVETAASNAEIAAETAAVIAVDATETASEAVTAASAAGAVAVDASEQATMAADVAVSAHSEIGRVESKLDSLAQEHTAFRDEIRGFFTRFENQHSGESDVQVVEVTHGSTDQATENGTDSGGSGSAGSSGNTPSRRHRFGRQ